MFRAGLHSHLKIATIRMEGSTLQQPKEAAMLCEEGMIIIETMSALSVPHSTKQVILAKTQNNKRKTNKHYINCGMKNHNVKICRKKKTNHSGNHRGGTTKSKSTEDIFICMSHLWFKWTLNDGLSKVC